MIKADIFLIFHHYLILERPAKQVIGDKVDLIGIIRKCLIYTEEDIPFYEMSPDWKNNRDDWLKRVKRYAKIIHPLLKFLN